MKKYFEFKDSTSNKFWEINLKGNQVIITFGRIGNKPQQIKKKFNTNEESKKFAETKIREKTNKGYIEKKAGSSSKKSIKIKVKEPELGNKKKLIDIKKKFKLDKFIQILNEKERGDIFDAISQSSNIEVGYYDELHRKPNVGVFFNKVNPNLIYEPLIGIYDSNEDNYFAYEMGLLRINFNPKKKLTFLIRNSESNAQGHVDWKKCFKENENISDKKLLKIASDELNWDFSSTKMPGSEVYFFKKLKWSKDKLKKKFYSSKVKFY